MIFSYLNKDNLYDQYRESKKYTDLLTRPFPEFERIARNRPHPSIDKRYPKTTDGTTASIVRKTPKRVIQQLPTGKVVSDNDGWLGIVAGFIYSQKIIPYANEEYSLIQKGWSVVEKGLTFGSCATYAPFLNHDGYFCPDLTIPYWGDIFLQKGKKSGYDCSYVFLRAWWQKEDIEALIDKESQLAASAKKRKEKYDSSWDAASLKKILDAVSAKDLQATAPSDRERSTNTSGIELVTAFQKGVGATFYTFNPKEEIIVRTKVNKDPRGKIPIDWMYGDIDGSNPLGRGIVELVGGLQNLIDSDMQMYQFNRALMLAPPVIKRGSFSKKNIVYAPNAIIDVGSEAGAGVEPLKIDTSAVVNYPALYGLQKSQLLNLTNSPDTTTSSQVGNPTQSKTPAGVNQQQSNISVDDNYVRKMFEVWFEAWSETAINLYFAERSGIEEIQLDKATAMKLRELPNFDMTLLTDDNLIKIDYDTDTPALHFRVDPSTTTVADKTAQVQDATNLLDLVMKYPMLNANFGGPIDIDVLARRIVINSGIDDPEQVAPEPTAAQIQSKEEQKNTVSPFSPMFDKPKISIGYNEIPPAGQLQLLASAGIHVEMADVLAGPVIDPNARGTINPVDDPNILIPGGGQAAQSTPSQAGQVEAHMPPQPPQMPQADPTQQPQAAQPQQPMAQPVQQVPQQPELPQQEAQEPAGQQNMQEEIKELSPQDQQIIMHLEALGFPKQIIQEAIQMAEQGYTADQIMQALGQAQGAQHG